MKCKDIQPCNYYAVGKDDGSSFTYMRKIFVVSVGKWRKERWNNHYTETGPTTVGFAEPVGLGNRTWVPSTTNPGLVWGLWEDWEKEKARRKQKRDEDQEKKDLVYEKREKQIESIEERLQSLGLSDEFFSARKWDYAAKVALDLMEKLLDLAEKGKKA